MKIPFRKRFGFIVSQDEKEVNIKGGFCLLFLSYMIEYRWADRWQAAELFARNLPAAESGMPVDMALLKYFA
ncbi:MAG: hypothetical protein DBY04_05045 [Clostridiales bacterium]|nr:MAG: hypothetical protein DBY04_05045 [Clostridiales bacterium]